MSLRSLSDPQILSRIQRLVRRERRITLLVLDHLNELERRGLHLKLGYSSLFDYCTGHLGYSASAAVRRIKTARCLVRFSQLSAALEAGAVNLSTIAQISGVLGDENADGLLARIRGKSQREVEAIVAEYQPGVMPRDRVRTIVVRVPARASCAGALKYSAATPSMRAEPVVAQASAESDALLVGGAMPTSIACEKGDYNRNGCEYEKPAKAEVPPQPTTLTQTETRTLLQFSVRPEFMNKLNRLKSLAWHRLPANASLEQVFELALDLAGDKIDPIKRIKRREEKRERKAIKRCEEETREHRREGTKSRRAKGSSPGRRRHVAAATRDAIFDRDGGRCAFVGNNGHRCDANAFLQLDHINPVARGGAGVAGNLRLLCAQHNRYEAERLMGRGMSSSPP